MKVLLFGGTGFIGNSLAGHLTERGFEVVQLARHPVIKSRFRFVQWDGVTVGDWAKELEGAAGIVNLTGRSVDCIKTPENCDVILRSRVDSCRAIGEALKTVNNPPPVWVQMSTAHIYGDPPNRVLSEGGAFGYGLAPFVGQAWEAAFAAARPKTMRGVRLRTSFVIGKHGGALASLSRIVKLGLGGTVGHGRQGMSWIHEDDMNEIIHQAIVDANYEGPYICTAPNPVSNKVFMSKLRQALRVPIGLPAPAPLVKLGAKYLFGTDPELALYGRYVVSERLPAVGYSFKFPELTGALRDLCS